MVFGERSGKMHKKPMYKRPMHEQLRPGCNRDDAGAKGESLFRLADAIERRAPDVTIASTATPAETWHVLDDLIKQFDDEESFRHNQWQALSVLEQWAGRATAT
jgi:hypothetical protein